MAGEKIIGYATIVKCDHDDNASFTTIGCMKSITPPPQSLNTADGTCLEDSFEYMQPGIQKATEFKFLQVWKMGDTNHAIIDTLFANAKSTTAPYDVDWQVVYPQANLVTDAFSGWVKDVAPNTVQIGEYITREVTVMTTSDTTRTQAS